MEHCAEHLPWELLQIFYVPDVAGPQPCVQGTIFHLEGVGQAYESPLVVEQWFQWLEGGESRSLRPRKGVAGGCSMRSLASPVLPL